MTLPAPATAAFSPVAAPSTVTAAAAHSYRAQRLTKAAHEFEGMMLTELLKPLGKTDDEAVGGSDSSGSNPLQTFGIQAVAGALANSGALGFARQIEQALANNTRPTSTPSSTQPSTQPSTLTASLRATGPTA